MKACFLTFSGFAVLCFFYQGLCTGTSEGVQSNCGGLFSGVRGVIESPDYPNNYPHNLNCFWYLSVPEHSRLRLRFTALDVEGKFPCPHDVVEVYDGTSANSTMLKRLCGIVIPSPIEASTNVMKVRFYTDVSKTGHGFRAKFEKVLDCGGELSSEEGNLTSPNFPGQYSSFQECVWVIKVPKGYNVMVRFHSFELEESPGCGYDFVDLRDGPDVKSPLLGWFCGSEVPREIRSSGNSMTIRFKSDGKRNFRGFFAHYKEVVHCGGELSSEEGDVTSPHYPNDYAMFLDCVWVITVPKGYDIMVRFRSFQLEESPGCRSDFVELLDGPNSSPLGRVCGSGVPREIVSSGNSMKIRFKSDGDRNFRGFSAHYHKVKPSGVRKSSSVGTRNIPGLLTTVIMILLLKFSFK